VTGASARSFAVIGDPVAHSVSPPMQRAAFAAAGIEATYVAERVSLDSLAAAWPELSQRLEGWNVTRPLKEPALGLVDRLAPEAAACGSVNTVVLDEDRRTTGHSTDGDGFLAGLARVRPRPIGRALILGTGGATRAVAAALSGAGARVELVGRNRESGEAVAADLAARGATVAYAGPPDGLSALLPGADLVVNATPVGDPSMPGRSPIPDDVELDALEPRPVVYDLVYRPRRTPLLAAAAAAGCPTVEGIEMLIEQGARSFELWTGVPAPVDEMRAAAYRALDEQVAVGGTR
jgi:shikimate dehydrogenase